MLIKLIILFQFKISYFIQEWSESKAQLIKFEFK